MEPTRGVERGPSRRLRERPGQARGEARGARGEDRPRLEAPRLGEEAPEAPQRRERAGEGARRDAAAAPGRQEGAELGGGDAGEPGGRRRPAPVEGEEAEETLGVPPVGGESRGRRAPARAEPGEPVLDECRRRGVDQASQRRIAFSNTPPKKPSRSTPWSGLKRCGSSEAKSRSPGRFPAPRSSRISASERIQRASSP